MNFQEILQLLQLIVQLLDKLAGLGVKLDGLHANDVLSLFTARPPTPPSA